MKQVVCLNEIENAVIKMAKLMSRLTLICTVTSNTVLQTGSLVKYRGKP